MNWQYNPVIIVCLPDAWTEKANILFQPLFLVNEYISHVEFSNRYRNMEPGFQSQTSFHRMVPLWPVHCSIWLIAVCMWHKLSLALSRLHLTSQSSTLLLASKCTLCLAHYFLARGQHMDVLFLYKCCQSSDIHRSISHTQLFMLFQQDYTPPPHMWHMQLGCSNRFTNPLQHVDVFALQYKLLCIQPILVQLFLSWVMFIPYEIMLQIIYEVSMQIDHWLHYHI